MKFSLRICLLLVLLFSTSTHAGIRVPGTKVSIDPPNTFTASDRFSGFQDLSTGSSIVVTEIPGPFSEVSKGMTAPLLETRGIKLLDKKSLESSKLPNALLLNVSQFLGNIEYRKWMLIFGDSDSTVMIVGNFPTAVEGQIGQVIKESILSAYWDQEAKVSFFDGLNFRIDPIKDLKIVNRLSNLVILGREGEFGTPGAGKPYMMVGPSGVPSNADLGVISKQALYQDQHANGIKIISEKSTSLGKYPVYIVIADAVNKNENIDVSIFQAFISTDSTVYFAQGRVKKEMAATYLPVFEEIAKTFKLVN